MHSTDTLKTLLSAGAGITVDAKAVSINALNELAAIAQSNQAPLCVTHAGHLLKDSIERLAAVGGQHIRFEF
ncbi:MAG: hypothetical protein Q8Q50_02705 [Methylobacter sp.]|nr:hypothetical protein [Methylobacter sp.]